MPAGKQAERTLSVNLDESRFPRRAAIAFESLLPGVSPRAARSADTAPGIALQTLLRNAKASALREVIGPSIVDTLQGLDPELDSGTRLGELAASLVEPSEALRDAEMRDLAELAPFGGEGVDEWLAPDHLEHLVAGHARLLQLHQRGRLSWRSSWWA